MRALGCDWVRQQDQRVNNETRMISSVELPVWRRELAKSLALTGCMRLADSVKTKALHLIRRKFIINAG